MARTWRTPEQLGGQDPGTGQAEEEAEGLETLQEIEPSIHPNVKLS